MSQHLQQFARQLALWTELIIDNGRTPFRRVDTFPTIDTELGPLQPPLVLWINRQSMMAGGLLLLPEEDLHSELNRGRSCASALGLRHFVTWETDRVRIWHVENDSVKEQQTFPLTAPEHPETFRYLLDDLLDALKLLAILGAIPLHELSCYYFNNLFLITLEQALPPLIEAHRSQRSETEEASTEDADSSAREANRLLLLQVLALLWFKALPETFLPEKMERAFELSLPKLPEPLQQAFSLRKKLNPPPLPLETAICFHHLLLRLRQLSWNKTEERAKQSLQRLIEYWYSDKPVNVNPASVHIHPEDPPVSAPVEMVLSNSQVLLAATAFMKNLLELHNPEFIFGNLFQLETGTLPAKPIFARLLNNNGIMRSERREYTTRLRAAWPNRHLKIATGQPFWMWEFIHLLGLCRNGQQLSIELPIDALRTAPDEPIWALLFEHFSFQELRLLKNNTIFLQIIRNGKSDTTLPVHRPDAIRVINPSANPTCFRNQLLLALSLPSEIYRLLGDELIWPDPEDLTVDESYGWQHYSESRLYHWLKHILRIKGGTIDPPLKMNEAIQTCIPHPDPLLLRELATSAKTPSNKNQPLQIDHLLADLLACPAVESIELPKITRAQPMDTATVDSGKKLKEELFEQLAAYGVPNFPEQYLYFLEQPEMYNFSFTSPLTVKNKLLGQFELEDARGQVIEGVGDELEQALLLCAESGKNTIDLPVDRHQLELMLTHYKKDLNSLYKHLQNLCYSRIENSKSAGKLVKKTWEKLALPAPAWFKN